MSAFFTVRMIQRRLRSVCMRMVNIHRWWINAQISLKKSKIMSNITPTTITCEHNNNKMYTDSSIRIHLPVDLCVIRRFVWIRQASMELNRRECERKRVKEIKQQCTYLTHIYCLMWKDVTIFRFYLIVQRKQICVRKCIQSNECYSICYVVSIFSI